ncbi:hypothetical protein GCM10023116_39540 [Kistimonas scapharcae]|uniref:Tail fiber protein n=1 Tax=Kistimonas scapharcae TaxID=1036133 RepID=A0ABP8V8T0_9GAMM
MHRIDGPGATIDKRFTEGDPVAGVQATMVTESWLNAIQEELVSVIGEENLDKNKSDQLLTAILSMAARQDVGKLNLRIVDPANLPTLAPNEIVPMGQLLNRADYPEWWSYIEGSGCMVTDAQWQQSGMEAFYSSGDGSTTFRPGNLVTGVFPRFLDLTGLYDPDRNSRTGGNLPGAWQSDAIRNITGSLDGSAEGLFPTNEPVGQGALRSGTHKAFGGLSGGATGWATKIDFDASLVVPTANENRPVSVAILPTYTYK